MPNVSTTCVVGIEALPSCVVAVEVVTDPVVDQPIYPQPNFVLEFFLSGSWQEANYDGITNFGETDDADLVVPTRIRNTGNIELTFVLTRTGAHFTFSGSSTPTVAAGDNFQFDTTFVHTDLAGVYDGEISALSTVSVDITKETTVRVTETTPPFSPTDIPGLVTWYDASQITGKTDGQTVAPLNDLAGFVNLQSLNSPTWDPVYKTNIQNGLPCLRFGASGLTILRNTVSASLPGLSTIVIVARIRTPTLDNASANFGGALFVTSGLATVNLRGVAASTNWSLGFSQATDYRLNGVLTPSGAANPTVSSIYEWSGVHPSANAYQYSLGYGGTVVNWLEFDLFEFLAYSGDFTTGQRASLMSYLSRWGIF